MSNIEVSSYNSFVAQVKQQFKNAQIKASVAVNRTLLEFYWYLGSEIVKKEQEFAWGSNFIIKLSDDLSKEFPEVKGFSARNLKYIRQWYKFWNGQQVVAQLVSIPWGHNIVIISKCKNRDEALFYINKTIENGYSRAVLVHQIERNLYARMGKAVSNFDTKLPALQSDLAKETLKDPYCFDFLAMREKYNENELEDALSQNITDFLLELGVGFAYVGRQYKIEVNGDEFKIDMLFYHIKLRCYVVVELKVVDFKPEFAGKLNFYTSAIDEILKDKPDNPTIGLLICKSKNSTVVEYTLRGIEKPLGVSEYQLSDNLPKNFDSSLPKIEEIEKELEKLEGDNNE